MTFSNSFFFIEKYLFSILSPWVVHKMFFGILNSLFWAFLSIRRASSTYRHKSTRPTVPKLLVVFPSSGASASSALRQERYCIYVSLQHFDSGNLKQKTRGCSDGYLKYIGLQSSSFNLIRLTITGIDIYEFDANKSASWNVYSSSWIQIFLRFAREASLTETVKCFLKSLACQFFYSAGIVSWFEEYNTEWF